MVFPLPAMAGEVFVWARPRARRRRGFELHGVSSHASAAAKGRAVTYRPSIAERISWTGRQLRSSELNLLLALASCGDWETGQKCLPKWRTLIARSGLSRATVARTLVRLQDPSQPGGPWIVATSRRHRNTTTYDICLHRLATAPPAAQQVPMTPLLDAAEDAECVNFESQNETQNKFESQNETQKPDFESQNETPLTVLPVFKNVPVPVRTHSTRARDGRSDRIHTPDGQVAEVQSEPEQRTRDLPLVGAAPPPRCAHPHAHAWCAGRVHVPKALHFQFLDRLDTRPGESPQAKAGRLIAFYASVNAALPADQPIGEDDFKFWRRQFAAAFAATPQTTRDAWRRAVMAPVLSEEQRATVAARQQQRAATDEAADEAAARAYDQITADARAELERQADAELQGYRSRMTAKAYAESLRAAAIRLLKQEGVIQRRNAERKQG